MNREEFVDALHRQAPSTFRELRELCAQSIQAFPDTRPMTDYVVAGGVYLNLDDHPDCLLGEHDARRLRQLIFYQLRSGQAASPDFTARAGGFLHGEDFLATDYACQNLLISYLPNGNPADPETLRNRQIYDPANSAQAEFIAAFQKAIAEGDLDGAEEFAKAMYFTISPHNTPGAWRARLERARPDVIACINGGMDEVNIAALGLSGFKVLLSGMPGRHLRIGREIEKARWTDGWDIAVSNRYVETVGPRLSSITLLGCAARADHFETLTPNRDFSAGERPSAILKPG